MSSWSDILRRAADRMDEVEPFGDRRDEETRALQAELRVLAGMLAPLGRFGPLALSEDQRSRRTRECPTCGESLAGDGACDPPGCNGRHGV